MKNTTIRHSRQGNGYLILTSCYNYLPLVIKTTSHTEHFILREFLWFYQDTVYTQKFVKDIEFIIDASDMYDAVINIATIYNGDSYKTIITQLLSYGYSADDITPCEINELEIVSVIDYTDVWRLFAYICENYIVKKLRFTINPDVRDSIIKVRKLLPKIHNLINNLYIRR